MNNFVEAEHPRDKYGKFTTKQLKDLCKIDYGKFVKSGETTELIPDIKEGEYKGTDKYPKTTHHYVVGKTKEEQYNQLIDIENLYGKEYKGYKGQKAIEKLRKEQNGHVKNAFFRNDIGMIDLVWGNENRGLYHSIIHRQKENINIDDFLSNLSEVIEQGKNKGYGDNNTLEVWHKGKMAIISPIYHGYKTTFVLTAFKRTKEPKHVNERQKIKGLKKDPL